MVYEEVPGELLIKALICNSSLDNLTLVCYEGNNEVKSIITFLLIVLSCSFSFGQRVPKFFLGLEVGTNVSSLNNSSGQASVRLGFLTGVRVNYFLPGKIGLSGGLLFAHERTFTSNHLLLTDSASLSAGKLEIMNRFSWLEMPLSFEYFIVEKETFSIFVGAGLSVARLIDSEMTLTAQTSTVNSITLSDYDQVSPWNIFPGIQVGMSMHQKSRLITWVIFIQSSVHEIYKETVLNPNLSYDVINNTAKLGVLGTSLRYSFRVSKMK